MQLRPLLFLPVLLGALAGAPSTAGAAQAGRHHFIDIYEYLSSDAQFDAWFSLTDKLRSNFDYICGDTFCEGDYSDIQSIDFRCSVGQITGRIGQCVWVFAGSYNDIDSNTGAINVTAQTWSCITPLAPHTTIDELLSALAGDEPLHSPLPDTQTTIYDGLIDCL
jgi:hypothetical protein